MSEQWVSGFDDRMQARVLFAAWLIPATALVVAAAAGLGFTPGSVEAGSLLAPTQAGVSVLAVVTVLVALRCAIVRLPGGFGPGHSRLGIAGLLCCSTAGGCAAVAAVFSSLATVAVPSAAIVGLAGGLCWARCLHRLPGVDAGPIVGLAAAMSGQLTIGWLPVLEPSRASSPVLLLLGALVAGAALRAASADPFAAVTAAVNPALDLDSSATGSAAGGGERVPVALTVGASRSTVVSVG